MRYTKTPFKIDDASNERVLEMLGNVAGILKVECSKVGLDRALTLEGFGRTLDQQAWGDEVGWYVSYRKSAFYDGNQKATRAAEAAEQRFFALFPNPRGKDRKVEDDGRTVTLAVATDYFSIGD